MLRLKSDTSSAWIAAALANLDEILIDHVHCEKKAAATALALINRYPQHTSLVRRMAEHASEELEHVTRVLAHVERRGRVLTRDTGDAYVQELLALVRKDEPQRMLDTLICAALIEARSCERFTLLAAALPEGEVKSMYTDLIASEAGHYSMFLAMAREYCVRENVDARFDELASAEAAILAKLPNEPRMHG
jgi:tRNA-(ms[2]io[6]A)-hydroxylase